jgi:hypothetical protein
VGLEYMLDDSLIGENYASKYRRLEELFKPKTEVYKKAIEKLNGKSYIPYIPTLGKWVEFGFAGNNLFIEIAPEKYSNDTMDLEVLKIFRGPLIAPAIENFRKNYYGINNLKANAPYIVWIKNDFFGKMKEKELWSLSSKLQESSLAAQSNTGTKSKSNIANRNSRIFSTSSPKKARQGSTTLFGSGDESSAEEIAKQLVKPIDMQQIKRGRAATTSPSISSSTPSPPLSSDPSSDFASPTVSTSANLSPNSTSSSISSNSSSTSSLSTDRTIQGGLLTSHQEFDEDDEGEQTGNGNDASIV